MASCPYCRAELPAGPNYVCSTCGVMLPSRPAGAAEPVAPVAIEAGPPGPLGALIWFFALSLIPIAALHFVLPPGRDWHLSAIVTPLAALLVCWAYDVYPRGPRESRRRAAVFAGVTCVTAVCLWLAATWLLGQPQTDRWGLVALIAAAVSGGWALSGSLSPTHAIRSLVRPLAQWRAPWQAYLLALLIWPAIAAAVFLTVHSSMPLQPQWRMVAVAPLLGFPSVAAFVVGWYGLGARGLLERLSPLVAGLILGCLGGALSLASLAPLIVRQPSDVGPIVHLLAADVLVEVVTSVAAVWLVCRSQGSLLPVVVLLAAAPIVQWSSPAVLLGGENRSLVAYAVLAVAVVYTGRMWRRPAAGGGTEIRAGAATAGGATATATASDVTATAAEGSTTAGAGHRSRRRLALALALVMVAATVGATRAWPALTTPGSWHRVISWQAGTSAAPSGFWDSLSPAFTLHHSGAVRLRYSMEPATPGSAGAGLDVAITTTSGASCELCWIRTESVTDGGQTTVAAVSASIPYAAARQSGRWDLVAPHTDPGSPWTSPSAPPKGDYRLAVKCSSLNDTPSVYEGQPPVILTVWEQGGRTYAVPLAWLIAGLAALGAIMAGAVAGIWYRCRD